MGFGGFLFVTVKHQCRCKEGCCWLCWQENRSAKRKQQTTAITLLLRNGDGMIGMLACFGLEKCIKSEKCIKNKSKKR